MDRIAAVTYTHQAAGEMKLRVRQKLEDLRTPEASRALQHLDRAFIGTIHAFCANLLRQRPVEADVDPDFKELDQGQARRLFSRSFRVWITKRLESPSPVLRRAFARLAWRDSIAEPIGELESAAWDLAEWRDHPAPWEKKTIAREERVTELIDQIRNVAELWPRNETTWARTILTDFVQHFELTTTAEVFDFDEAESEIIGLRRRLNAASLDKRTEAGQAWLRVKEAIKYFADEADADFASHLRDELWAAVETYQAAKHASGCLDFADLLLCADRLVCHNGARGELQGRYDRIFVDEFQDTDPLQARIMTTLGAGGKLFIVGDPKQSIYRFRRADPRTYLRTKDLLVSGGATVDQLTTSYRSTAPIQSFVNSAFGACIANYLPLSGGPFSAMERPSIVALPMPSPYDGGEIKAPAILACSPAAVAAFILRLTKTSEWTVRDGKSDRRRGIKADDICILFRRFSNSGRDLTQDYVRCLESRNIDHVLVGSKGLHTREETSAIRTALRAVEWPDDELSVYAVLHGPLYGIDDSTLLRFKEQHGRLRPFAEPPEEVDPELRPIWQALEILRELHRRRNHVPIAETIRSILDSVRAHATIAFHKGGSRRLANLHRIAELARQADSRGDFTFRGFVRWLDEEARSSAANRLVLDVEGSVEQIENALHVHMAIYRLPPENHTFYSPDREPSLALSAPVWHIEGLDNFLLVRNHRRSRALTPEEESHLTGSGPKGYYLGSDMRAAYYGGTALTGKGQVVGLFEYYGYESSDIQNYFKAAGQTNAVPIHAVTMDGVSASCSPPRCDDSEQVLDIVQAISMALGLSQLRVYIGSRDADILNQMATENVAKQLSCSVGHNGAAVGRRPDLRGVCGAGAEFRGWVGGQRSVHGSQQPR